MSDQNNSLVPPRPIGLEGARDSMATTASADPSFKGHPSDSVVGLPVDELNGHSEKPKRGKRPLVVAAVGLAALAVVVVAVIVPVYYKVIKPKNNTAESSSSSGGTGGGDPTSTDPSGGGGSTPTSGVVTWGGDGLTITKDDGSTFTYNNKFGGFWVNDPA